MPRRGNLRGAESSISGAWCEQKSRKQDAFSGLSRIRLAWA